MVTEFLHKTIIPEASKVSQIGYAGWDPIQPMIITQLTKGMPAEQAGLLRGTRFSPWTESGFPQSPP